MLIDKPQAGFRLQRLQPQLQRQAVDHPPDLVGFDNLDEIARRDDPARSCP